MNNHDVHFLNMLCNLYGDSPDERFSLTYSNGYWEFAVGKHKYLTPTITLESLMDANIYILASIRKDGGW